MPAGIRCVSGYGYWRQQRRTKLRGTRPIKFALKVHHDHRSDQICDAQDKKCSRILARSSPQHGRDIPREATCLCNYFAEGVGPLVQSHWLERALDFFAAGVNIRGRFDVDMRLPTGCTEIGKDTPRIPVCSPVALTELVLRDELVGNSLLS